MKMQLRNFFAIAKPFRLKKSQKKQILSGFKSQIGNPAFHLGLINVTFIPQQTVLFPAKSWEWSTRCNWPPTTKWQHPLIGRLVFLLRACFGNTFDERVDPQYAGGCGKAAGLRCVAGARLMGEWGRADFIAACSVLTARKISTAVTVFFLPRMHFLSLWCYGSDWVSKDLDILSTYCQECSTLSLKV